MTKLDALLARIDAMRRECESAMRDHMGGGTYCQIHKDGHVTGGLKYEEGRLVAFGNVRRQVKHLSPDANMTQAVSDIIAAEAATWAAELERHRAKERPAMTWIAYSQGGVDATGQLRRALLDESPV